MMCRTCSTNGKTTPAGPSGLCGPCLKRAASGGGPLGRPAVTPMERYISLRARGESKTLAAAMAGVSPTTAREKFEPEFLARCGLLPDVQDAAARGEAS